MEASILSQVARPLPVEDELAIFRLLFRYATGIDRRDWKLFHSCFADGFEGDYEGFGLWHGPQEITDFMEDAHRDLGATLHRISNIVVEDKDGEVFSRSYVDCILTDPARNFTHRASGIYDDQQIKGPRGWQILRRKFTMVDRQW